MAIASRAAECAQLFDKCASTLAGDEVLMQDMENQIFRFNLWVTNNFILAPRRASMDWRLRNAPLLQSTMVELLDDLKADLITQSTLPHNVIMPIGMQDENPFHAVSETLDGLFRLSRAIRRSGILRRYVKVGNYVEFDKNGVNLTEAFRNGAKMLIEFRMKESKASEGLRERIIDTVCLRQQYFSYLKARKAQNAPIEKTDQSHQSTPRSALRATVSVTGSLTSKAPGNATNQSPRMPRAGPSIMTATTAQPDRMQKAYSVKSANEKTSHDVDCSDADIPPPPNVSGNLQESECPYCFLACSREELSGTRWNRHIIQDLMPYICVLEPCPTPDSLFESGKDWLSHMRNQHPTSGWTCVDSTHDTTFSFQARSGFMDHLHQYHEDQFDDDDIDDIAAACYQQIPEDIMIRECPFCPTAQIVELEPGDMINHIANHLISLAQISLAGHMDGGQSQSAWSGSTRDPSSRPVSVGSLPKRLQSEFTDNDEDGTPVSVLGEVIPDADAELVHALWQKVQKPHEDPALDRTLHHFIVQFEMQVKEITKDVDADSNGSVMWQSFKEGQATAPEPGRGSGPGSGKSTSPPEGDKEHIELLQRIQSAIPDINRLLHGFNEDDKEHIELLQRIQSTIPDINRLLHGFRHTHSRLSNREAEIEQIGIQHEQALIPKDYYIEALQAQMKKMANESAEESAKLENTINELRLELMNLQEKQIKEKPSSGKSMSPEDDKEPIEQIKEKPSSGKFISPPEGDKEHIELLQRMQLTNPNINRPPQGFKSTYSTRSNHEAEIKQIGSQHEQAVMYKDFYIEALQAQMKKMVNESAEESVKLKNTINELRLELMNLQEKQIKEKPSSGKSMFPPEDDNEPIEQIKEKPSSRKFMSPPEGDKEHIELLQRIQSAIPDINRLLHGFNEDDKEPIEQIKEKPSSGKPMFPPEDDKEHIELLQRMQFTIPDINRLLHAFRHTHSRLSSREAEIKQIGNQHKQALIYKDFYIEALEAQMRKTANESAEESAKLENTINELRLELMNLQEKQIKEKPSSRKSMFPPEDDKEHIELLQRIQSTIPDINHPPQGYESAHSTLSNHEDEIKQIGSQHEQALMHKDFYIEALQAQMRKTANESAEESVKLENTINELRLELMNLQENQKDLEDGPVVHQKLSEHGAVTYR